MPGHPGHRGHCVIPGEGAFCMRSAIDIVNVCYLIWVAVVNPEGRLSPHWSCVCSV